MRTIIIAGLPAMALMLIPLCISAFQSEDTGAPLEWEAQYTGQTEPFEKVISTQPDFKAAGEALFHGHRLPDVDFNKNVAVCVCLGARMTGGYRIVFHPPYLADDEMVVTYHEKRPAGITTQALTQPCAMKVFERKEGRKVQVKRTVDPGL